MGDGTIIIPVKIDGSNINSDLNGIEHQITSKVKSIESKVNSSGKNIGASLSKGISSSINVGGIQSSLTSQLGGLSGKLGSLGGSLGKVFAGGFLGVALGLLMGGIAALPDAISRIDIMGNYENVMSNLGVSSDDAKASIDRLQDALTGLPTTLDDAALSVQRFTSANGNVKASTEMFLALNNAVLAGGANAQTQATAIEQLSQAYAKGKPDMMEWRTAMTAMPAQLKQVAISMGYVSADQLGEALRSGAVSMNQFMMEMIKLNKEGVNGFQSFEQQARNSTGGIQTSMVNMKTAFVRGMASILDAIGRTNIAGFFNIISKAVSVALDYIAAFVKILAIAIAYVGKLFGLGKSKKQTKKTNDSLKQTGVSLGNIGGAGETASAGLDKTTGSAKKLNKELKQLASFDEMNILKEANEAAEKAGYGGIGGGGAIGVDDIGALDDYLKGLEEVEKKSNSAFEKIKKWWHSGDFLKGDNYKETISNLAKYMGSIYKGTWDMITQPIWKEIKPFLEDLKEVSRFLWEPMVTRGKEAFAIMKNTVKSFKKELVKIKEATKPVWEPMYQEFQKKFMEPMRESLKTFKERFMQTFGPFINGIIRTLNKLLDPLGLHIDEIGTKTSTVGNKTIDIINTAKTSMEQATGKEYNVKVNNKQVQQTKDLAGNSAQVLNAMANRNYNIKVDSKSVANVSQLAAGVGASLNNMVKKQYNFKATMQLNADTSNAATSIARLLNGISSAVKIKIPKLAAGGIVNHPGPGVLMGSYIAGERGAEAVIPLDDATLDRLGEAFARHTQINANIVNTMNGRVISRELQKIDGESNFAFNG